MWPPIEDQPSAQMAPRRDTPGCFLQIVYLILVGSWLSFITTAVAWVLVVSGVGSVAGMRLLGRLPRLMFQEHADEEFSASTIEEAAAIESNRTAQHSPAVRVPYAVLIGWWLSGFALLIAWALMLWVVGIRVAIGLYCRIPRIATLAVYDA